jgi:hypothetical protein
MTTTTYDERTWDFGRLADVPQGPWTGEPDKVQWVDQATGLDCLIVRNRGGALCGYVGVPKGHPWFEVDYDNVRVARREDEDETFADWPQVHGGLTFASKCHTGAGDEGVCHVPYPGRPDDVWWLGFDCAHSDDVSPLYDREYGAIAGSSYKTIGYVKAEVAQLANQAKNHAVTLTL